MAVDGHCPASAILGEDAASGPVSREGWAHGWERAPGGVDPSEADGGCAGYGGVSAQREQRVCNRSLFPPAGLSQRNLPEGCAGAMHTATNTQT